MLSSEIIEKVVEQARIYHACPCDRHKQLYDQAFTLLFNELYPRLLSYFVKRFRYSMEDAEDLTQKTLFELWAHLHEFGISSHD